MNTWNENKEILWGILTDYLQSNELDKPEITNFIQNEFNQELQLLYKKRFDYEIQELNKIILGNIINKINLKQWEKPTKQQVLKKQQPQQHRIQNAPQQTISNQVQTPQNIFEKSKETNLFDDLDNGGNYRDKYAYTAEEIRAKKQLESQNMFDEKKREFEKYQDNFRPENIDFSDKPDNNNEKIDDVLKRVMESRNYELQLPEQDIKKAESWINNGREVKTNIQKQENKEDYKSKTNKNIKKQLNPNITTKNTDNNQEAKPQTKSKKEFINMLKNKLNKNKQNELNNTSEPDIYETKTMENDIKPPSENNNIQNDNIEKIKIEIKELDINSTNEIITISDVMLEIKKLHQKIDNMTNILNEFSKKQTSIEDKNSLFDSI
jgi:hypothetical protein